MGTRQDDKKVGDLETGIKAGIKQGDKRVEDPRSGNKKDQIDQAPELDIKVQSFLSRDFFLTTRLFFFHIISFSKSVTTSPGLSTTSLVINSASMTSIKCEAPASRYPVAEMGKQRAWRILSTIASMLKLSNFWLSIFQF